MHSLLITGGTEAQRSQEAAGVLNKDRLIEDADTKIIAAVEKDTIGIDAVRSLEKFLSRKPFATPFKVGVFLEAQKLTTPAQNALLKTLEEPPAHSKIILTTSDRNELLPTLVSRCQIIDLGQTTQIKLTEPENAKMAQEFLTILTADPKSRLFWINDRKEIYSQKNEVVGTLKVWLLVGRDLLLAQREPTAPLLNPDLKPQYDKIIRARRTPQVRQLQKLQHLVNLLETTNVNPRLTLEVFLLGLATD